MKGLGVPKVAERASQPYSAIKAFVTMGTLGQVLPGLHPRYVCGWTEQARFVSRP
jgi:hypothetical protein